MADEKDSAPKARPFTPPLPPFRGPAQAPRPSASPLTPPEGRRGSLFIGTRAPSASAAASAPEAIDIALLAPEPSAPTPREADSQLPPLGNTESPRAEAIAATATMPWLFNDPAAPVGQPKPIAPLPTIESAQTVRGEDAAPEEAAQALSGLPFFDQSGAEHQGAPNVRLSGKMHRIDFDVAGVLESIASRVRAGEIDISQVDPAAGEAATLATVLAELLRQHAR
jgi:hypothetical protein